MKARIGIVLGDPCGIGPEVVAKLVARQEARDQAKIVVIADPDVFARGCAVACVAGAVEHVADADEIGRTGDGPVLVSAGLPEGDAYPVGKASAEGGRYTLESLRAALRLAEAGDIDGIVYAPLNKEAMSLAGSPYPDEMLWIINEVGYTGPYCDCTVLGDLWTARVTSHVPVAEVEANISIDRVVEVARLIDETLKRAGVQQPRIAVSALNPHAGDGGLIGRTEIDVLAPAIERLRGEIPAIDGPFPPDTVFLKARDGDFDAVVTMYHDHGQTALKLMGFGRAISVIAGPDIAIATPAQGTAFDIVGQGIAKPDGVLAAFEVARRMGLERAKRARI
ncbi:MAG: 4-hydroxythreonine-4-phosphate dehydrogenase PdxA [Alphaproteobacteria bacterium]|nr:4-hydroxythreonine-4-phosphate dehydrogenase PdxA [Alphaproteobacteria bacterium]